MSLFTGSGVAIITPFTEDHKINFDVFGELLDFHLENNTDALIICGTTGESATMNEAEQKEAIKFAVDHVKGKIPVIGGAGSNDTRIAITLAKNAAEVGADGILAVTPYYNKATQNGLIQHFTGISEAVDLPIILYNVPGRTTVNLLPETILELSKLDNIVGVKEASGDLSQVAKLAHLVGDKLDIYSGNDDQILPVLSLGGVGVISVLANILPQETHDMVHSYIDGDTKTATEIQLKAIPLIDALFCEVNPIPVKAALNEMGYKAGLPRLPLTDMEEANKEILRVAMKPYNLM